MCCLIGFALRCNRKDQKQKLIGFSIELFVNCRGLINQPINQTINQQINQSNKPINQATKQINYHNRLRGLEGLPLGHDIYTLRGTRARRIVVVSSVSRCLVAAAVAIGWAQFGA